MWSRELLAGHEARATPSLSQCHHSLMYFPPQPAFLCLSHHSFQVAFASQPWQAQVFVPDKWETDRLLRIFLDSKLQMALVQTWLASIASIVQELRATLMFFCCASLWCTLSGILSYCLNNNLEQPQSVVIQCLLVSWNWSCNAGRITVMGNSESEATTKFKDHLSADGIWRSTSPWELGAFIGMLRTILGHHVICVQCPAGSRQEKSTPRQCYHPGYVFGIYLPLQKRKRALRALLNPWISGPWLSLNTLWNGWLTVCHCVHQLPLPDSPSWKPHLSQVFLSVYIVTHPWHSQSLSHIFLLRSFSELTFSLDF